jgi:hypothetical protein
MTSTVVFERCPMCGFSIFIVLAGDVRHCVSCREEWKAAQEFVPAVAAVQTAALKGGA